MVTLPGGHGVIGNDNWTTRRKSARKKKKNDTTHTVSSFLLTPLLGKLIKKSPWSGTSGGKAPFYLFIEHAVFR